MCSISGNYADFSIDLHDLILLNYSSIVFKPQEIQWCSFRWSITLSIGSVWQSHIDRIILTPSCWKFIWNRYFNNHRSILLNFPLFFMIWVHLPAVTKRQEIRCVVVADKFRYQFSMYKFTVLIALSWFLHAHNAYETDTSKIIAQYCRISYCFAWFDTLNSIVCCVQTTRYTMM